MTCRYRQTAITCVGAREKAGEDFEGELTGLHALSTDDFALAGDNVQVVEVTDIVVVCKGGGRPLPGSGIRAVHYPASSFFTADTQRPPRCGCSGYWIGGGG